MMRNIAVDYYKGKQGNCAQAVTFALYEKGLAPLEAVAEMKACGGGRAPERLCGALHAALRFAPDVSLAEALKSRFTQASGGHLICPQIRGAGALPCAGCVETAAALADELYLNK